VFVQRSRKLDYHRKKCNDSARTCRWTLPRIAVPYVNDGGDATKLNSELTVAAYEEYVIKTNNDTINFRNHSAYVNSQFEFQMQRQYILFEENFQTTAFNYFFLSQTIFSDVSESIK
jgi:hypothetical protein